MIRASSCFDVSVLFFALRSSGEPQLSGGCIFFYMGLASGKLLLLLLALVSCCMEALLCSWQASLGSDGEWSIDLIDSLRRCLREHWFILEAGDAHSDTVGSGHLL